MASTILADNGVSSGSAGIKTTADSTGALALQTTTAGGAATTAVTIDTSQNVGIGTGSPSQLLHLSKTGATTFYQRFQNSVNDLYIGLTSTGESVVSSNGAYPLVFQTSAVERARIDSSGNLLVGTTSGVGSGNNEFRASVSAGGTAVLVAYNSNPADSATAFNAVKASTTTSSSQRFIQFYANAGATAMGGIVGNGASNVQFAALSDAREKTNIQSISGSLEKINALRPVEFDWIADNTHVNAGFIAQEVEPIFPEFVIENIANEGQEERKGLTGGMTGGIIPHLVKAMQEQQALITTLTERITALEAK